MLREMIAADPLPDYTLAEGLGDILEVAPREMVERAPAAPGRDLVLGPETLEAARRLAPGADVYALEARWRAFWEATGRPRLRSPERAFLGWVAKAEGG